MASEPASLTLVEDLETLLEQLHPDSFGWALSCCEGNRDEAEDVLQAAYVRALEGKARFEERSSVKTWFFGVVRNVARETRRKQRLRAMAFRSWFRSRPEPPPDPGPEGSTSDEETRRVLERLLALLSPRQRELLHLVFYQDLTIEQAASVCGLTVGTARTHYERGKARLKQELSRAGDAS